MLRHREKSGKHVFKKTVEFMTATATTDTCPVECHIFPGIQVTDSLLIMSTEKKVTVTLGNEKAKFILSSTDLSVADFSGWVRSRFAISPDRSVLFKDVDGNGM